MRVRFAVPIAAFLFAALATPPAAPAQSAAEIVNTALAQHEARTRNIQNYTVTQRVMGVETQLYFEKHEVDGRQVFRSRTIDGQGPDGVGEWEDIYQGFDAFAQRARVQGTETVDGHRSHVLVVDDASDLPGMDPMPGQEFEVRTAIIFVDADDYVIRRMVMEGVATVEGQARPVTTTMDFQDYRDVQGLLHPFRTAMSVDGIEATVSAEEMAEARRGLEELRAQLADMPAAQRQMIERQMGPQIEQMESMLEGGAMEAVIEVVDVQINTGPPAG